MGHIYKVVVPRSYFHIWVPRPGLNLLGSD